MSQPSLETTAQAAITRWGAAAARAPTRADAVDGCAPIVVLEPPDVATLTEMLRWTNTDKLSVVPRGGGTKLGWGQSRGRVDAVLSTTGLSDPVDHCAGDLTVTVPAGTRLAALNAVLARERQWLPLDPMASDRATIGGVVATNDSGPRRQRHGTPRDLIIGVEMALVDGRRAKAGGRVVKNVAGYDLARMLCGSFGSLAVITSATFKLSPTPPASRTVVVTSDDSRSLADLALTVAASPLTASAIEIDAPPPRLFIRIETTEAAADRQAAAARDLCAARSAGASIVWGEAETTIWREHEERLTPTDGPLVRVAVLPTQVTDIIDLIDRVASQSGLGWQIGGRAALGVIYVLFAGSNGTETLPVDSRRGETITRCATAVEELRRNAWARGGSAVIVAASPALKAIVDPWGDQGDALPLMARVKARFDPNGILNPSPGPGGL